MRGERGSILPLVAGLIALVLAFSFLVVSATSLVMTRQRLHALAEATALFASESFDPGDLRMGSGELVVPLTTSGVRSSAHSYLSGFGRSEFADLTLVAADSPDGRRARVRLATRWRPPMISPYVPLSLRVEAQARSRALIR